MKLSHFSRKALLALGVAVTLAWQLTGCGGTPFASGVGSGGSGLAEGAVTGFGSVIVDGVAYDDSAATVERWGESGVAEAKLGQRVRVMLDKGQATRIVVLPQLIGAADSAPDAQGDFGVLGQRVRIVSSTQADLPATVLDGLTQVRAGDVLEVHGSWSRDSAGRNLLIASRIEKRQAMPELWLLTALVGTRSGNTLTLDDASHTPVTVASLPDSVQSGALVSLWLEPAVVQTPATLLTPWVATRAELASAQADPGATLDLRGVVRASQAGRIQVQGLWVALPADWSGAAPADGTPVQLKLVRSGSDWQASSLSVLRADTQPDVELKGSLRWPPVASSVQLRGTTVQLSPDLLTGSCAGLQAGEEVYISLKALRRSPGQVPLTSQIECSHQIPQASVQEAQGTLLNLDTTNKTLDVRVGADTLSLTWNASQTLMPPTGQLRSGMAVEIEYQRSSTGLMLRKLKPE